MPAPAAPAAAAQPAQAATTGPTASPHAGMGMTPNPAASALAKADEMDRHHEAGIKAFPAKTAVHGNQRLLFRLDGEVKVFEVTAQRIKWEVEPGKLVDAFAYNGMVPGPEIRVTEGDKVRVVLKNALDQSTAIHFHGQRTVNKIDGVPFITQPPVKPGETFSYEFVARPIGTQMYHSHHNATEQVGRGMLGPLIVMPKDPNLDPKYDKDEVIVLNEQLGGVTINGKGFPATAPFTAKVGQRIRFRFLNEGQLIHPMHLHGMPMQVFARDGYPLPAPFYCDTLNVAPGERWDAIVVADEPGAWAFHCHILGHAEGSSGMFGMVTALIVS
jgi:FtsP/CotA-like multicopper oxidase with cupredoxin domain